MLNFGSDSFAYLRDPYSLLELNFQSPSRTVDDNPAEALFVATLVRLTG